MLSPTIIGYNRKDNLFFLGGGEISRVEGKKNVYTMHITYFYDGYIFVILIQIILIFTNKICSYKNACILFIHRILIQGILLQQNLFLLVGKEHMYMNTFTCNYKTIQPMVQ